MNQKYRLLKPIFKKRLKNSKKSKKSWQKKKNQEQKQKMREMKTRKNSIVKENF